MDDLVSNATIRISGYAENADALCISMLGTDAGKVVVLCLHTKCVGQSQNGTTVTLEPRWWRRRHRDDNPIGKLDVRGAIMAPVVAFLRIRIISLQALLLITVTLVLQGGIYGFEHRMKVDGNGVPRIL